MTNRITLTTEGRAMIPFAMKPKNGIILEFVDFKLDTDADLTTISKKDLGILGYDVTWIKVNAVQDIKRTLSSAGGGKVPAYFVTIPVSNLFGKDFKQWPFYIRIEDDRDFPSLLGINILSYFNFTFNYDTGCLEIEAAKKPVIKLPLDDEQEVNELASI